MVSPRSRGTWRKKRSGGVSAARVVSYRVTARKYHVLKSCDPAKTSRDVRLWESHVRDEEHVSALRVTPASTPTAPSIVISASTLLARCGPCLAP
jgi:hypothetical protein